MRGVIYITYSMNGGLMGQGVKCEGYTHKKAWHLSCVGRVCRQGGQAGRVSAGMVCEFILSYDLGD